MRKNHLYFIGLVYTVIFGIYYINQTTFFNASRNPGDPPDISIIIPWVILVFYLISIWNVIVLKIKGIIIFGEIGSIIVIITLILISLYPLNFNSTLSPIYSIYSIICIISYNLLFAFTIIFNRMKFKKDEITLIKIILNLSTQFARLEVREISEDCKVDRDTIVKIVKKLIESKEIYADYFKSTKSVAFNQQANMEIMDKLLLKYNNIE